MKAFRSSIDDFEECHSITSTQSCQSVRGGGFSAYRLTASVDHNGAADHSSSGSTARTAIASFMQQTSSPQPYPYYHYRQHNQNASKRSTCKFAQESNKKGNLKDTPSWRFSPPAVSNSVSPNSANSCSPQAIVIENCRHGILDNHSSSGALGFFTSRTSGTNVEDRLEKIPLVQKWSPSTGRRETQKAAGTAPGSVTVLSSSRNHMGKSISLDTPVSIAHV